MPTRTTILTTVLVLFCSACDGNAPPKDIDTVWSDLTSEERVAHLEQELAAAEELLLEAENLEDWDAAQQRGQSALSLLRPEIWVENRRRFVDLEVELETIAQTTRAAL